MDQDLEHLRLLAVFHYVVAGLAALFSMIPVLHLVLGIAMATGGFDTARGEGPPAVVGWIFIVVASAVILAGLTFATLLALAGRFISRQRHYVFCLVMALLACAFFPFGTVLGVFALIVLLRDSVKARFPGAAAA